MSAIMAGALASSNGGAEDHVLEGPDEDATEPEHDDWAKHRATLHAKDGLQLPR